MVKRLSVLHQFLDTVKRYNLLKEKDRVLIGVSGGADSVCLTDLLRLVVPKFQLQLFGVHINHGLRETAVRDERFVKELLANWGIALTVVKVDVAGYAQRHKLSLEEAGRRLRYYHYERVAKRLRCERVALGHNADDNLETVLLNLVRGAGARGLAGIPIARGIFIRPLLDIEREPIRAHLKARGIEWVEDETNEDLRFSRNLLRHQVVPVLKQLNPAVVANVRRSAEIVGAEDKFLDLLATNSQREVAKRKKGWLCIDIDKFNSYNIVLRRRMIKNILPGLDAIGTERLLYLCEHRCYGRHQLQAGVEIELQKPKAQSQNALRLRLNRGGRKTDNGN